MVKVLFFETVTNVKVKMKIVIVYTLKRQHQLILPLWIPSWGEQCWYPGYQLIFWRFLWVTSGVQQGCQEVLLLFTSQSASCHTDDIVRSFNQGLVSNRWIILQPVSQFKTSLELSRLDQPIPFTWDSSSTEVSVIPLKLLNWLSSLWAGTTTDLPEYRDSKV